MQGEWNHDAAYYRCRFPTEYALANKISHPRNVYLREDAITPIVDRWLTKVFAPGRLASLIEQLHATQDTGPDATAEQARRAITDADRKLARHRAALEALGDDSDPALIAGWIAQTQAERAAAETRLRHATSRSTQMSRADIARLLAGFTDYLTVLRDADAGDKAALYGHIGLKLTYHPAEQTVKAEAMPQPYPVGDWLCPRGDLNPHAR